MNRLIAPLKCSTGSGDRLYPPFIDMYAQYICKHDPLCMHHAVVPDHDEQVTIVRHMRELGMQLDVSDVADALFALLLHGHLAKVEELLTLLFNYRILQDQIGDLINGIVMM